MLWMKCLLTVRSGYRLLLQIEDKLSWPITNLNGEKLLGLTVSSQLFIAAPVVSADILFSLMKILGIRNLPRACRVMDLGQRSLDLEKEVNSVGLKINTNESKVHHLNDHRTLPACNNE